MLCWHSELRRHNALLWWWGSWMLVSRFFFHPISNIKLCEVTLHAYYITCHVSLKEFWVSVEIQKMDIAIFWRNNGTRKKNIDITTYDEHSVCQIIRFYTQKDGGSFILHCISDTNFKFSISELTLLKDIVQTRNDHYSFKHLSPYTSQCFIKFPFKFPLKLLELYIIHGLSL